MTYIVTDNCINCKFGDCIEVCPVDCFYEGENMIVIDPEECIDCGVCESECPANAIISDTHEDAEAYGNIEKWVAHNQKYAKLWPQLTENIPPLSDAEKWDGVENKLETVFSEKPGKGS